MFRSVRRLMMIAVLGATVGVPYMVSTGHGIQSVRDWWNTHISSSASTSAGYEPVPYVASESDSLVPVTLPGEQPVTSECAPPHDLAEVFRFEATIDWIMLQWPNVSTIPINALGQGYRVPLVTGVREDDVAGSLTYYFGADRRVQRITFEGTTGNADRLIAVIAQPNGLTRRSTDDPGLFLYQQTSSGKTNSELRIRSADVMRAAAPHRRFLVSLVLTRPAPGWF